MPFYKKILKCGCIIKTNTINTLTNVFYLGGHSYYFICHECKSNCTKELLNDKLYYISSYDYKTSKKNSNDWTQFE